MYQVVGAAAMPVAGQSAAAAAAAGRAVGPAAGVNQTAVAAYAAAAAAAAAAAQGYVSPALSQSLSFLITKRRNCSRGIGLAASGNFVNLKAYVNISFYAVRCLNTNLRLLACKCLR